MTARTYPRERIRQVVTRAALPAGHRIIPRRFRGVPLGTAPADSRFCSKADGFTVLYAAPDFGTAFVEVVVRDRFIRRHRREILLKEVTERDWVLITSVAGAELVLLDVRNDGCVRIGAPTDAVNARNHAAGRALARAVHAEHEDIEGLLFSSRLTAGDVYAVFDRAIPKLRAVRSGSLATHPEIGDVLSRHRIELIVQE